MRPASLSADRSADRLTVLCDGRAVPVTLRRREGSRRMTLRVSGATGEIALTVPGRADLKAAQTFLDSHAGWVAARIAKLPARVRFLAGASVPLRGEPHRIVHWSRVRGATRASMDQDGAAVIVASGDVAAVPGRIRRFLVEEAMGDLRDAVARHAARIDAKPLRVTLRDTTSRWGSCSSTGALSFSWRLILSPSFVLDYLAAHEVAHLRELNHSHRFWKIVHDICPATEQAEAWLKRHGSGLHRYG